MSAAPVPVVLCHSLADRFAAETVRAALDDAGVPCVVAPADGSDKAGLAQALAAARVLVVVHSRATGDDRAMLRAVEAAAGQRLPIVAVRLDAGQPAAGLALFLRGVPWFDASDGTLPSRLTRLVTRVKQAAGLPLGDADLVDDGEGGIDLWTVERRRVHRGWVVAGTVVVIGVAILGWRAYERQAADRDYERGIALLAAGDAPAAAKSFSGAVARRPGWPEAWRQLAFASPDPKAQIAAFTRAVELDPADADAYAGRARAHAQLLEFGAAAADLDLALQRAPNTAAWYGERGLLRLLLGNEAGAGADFQRCAIIDPQCAESFAPRIAAAESALNLAPRDWFAKP